MSINVLQELGNNFKNVQAEYQYNTQEVHLYFEATFHTHKTETCLPFESFHISFYQIVTDIQSDCTCYLRHLHTSYNGDLGPINGERLRLRTATSLTNGHHCLPWSFTLDCGMHQRKKWYMRKRNHSLTVNRHLNVKCMVYMTLLKFTKWLREGCIVSSTKIIIQVQAYFQGSTIHVLLLLEIPAYFFCVYFIHIRLIFQN